MNTLRTRPWALLFFISLAINIFFCGILSARWMHRRNMNGARGPAVGQPHREMGPDEKAFQERLRVGHGAEFETRMKALQEARGKVKVALKKEPFDVNAANLAFAEVRERSSAMQQLVHETMLETAQGLSPQERARLAKALERGPGAGQWMGRMGAGPPSASSQQDR